MVFPKFTWTQNPHSLYNTCLIIHRITTPQDTHWEIVQGNYRENEIWMIYTSRSGETKSWYKQTKALCPEDCVLKLLSMAHLNCICTSLHFYGSSKRGSWRLIDSARKQDWEKSQTPVDPAMMGGIWRNYHGRDDVAVWMPAFLESLLTWRKMEGLAPSILKSPSNFRNTWFLHTNQLCWPVKVYQGAGQTRGSQGREHGDLWMVTMISQRKPPTQGCWGGQPLPRVLEQGMAMDRTGDGRLTYGAPPIGWWPMRQPVWKTLPSWWTLSFWVLNRKNMEWVKKVAEEKDIDTAAME